MKARKAAGLIRLFVGRRCSIGAVKANKADDSGDNSNDLVYYAANGEDEYIVDEHQSRCEQDALSECLRITGKCHSVHGKTDYDEDGIVCLPGDNAVYNCDSGEYVRNSGAGKHLFILEEVGEISQKAYYVECQTGCSAYQTVMHHQKYGSGGQDNENLLVGFCLIRDKCQYNGDYAENLADDDSHEFTLVSVKFPKDSIANKGANVN